MTELLHLENYSFTYPQQRRPALSHVTLTVPEGAFMVLCGPSGCGKSTLLRQLKTVLAPHGLREGEMPRAVQALLWGNSLLSTALYFLCAV